MESLEDQLDYEVSWRENLCYAIVYIGIVNGEPLYQVDIMRKYDGYMKMETVISAFAHNRPDAIQKVLDELKEEDTTQLENKKIEELEDTLARIQTAFMGWVINNFNPDSKYYQELVNAICGETEEME